MDYTTPTALMPTIDASVYDPYVYRIFSVDDVTLGKGPKDYLVRYRGHLLSEDTIAAYDQISKELAPLNVTPLFRKEEGRQAIYIVAGRVTPKPGNPWINLLMFVLTLLSVIFVGGTNSEAALAGGSILSLFIAGIPFAAALLVILVAHEFGHYLVARAHGVHVSLPYFIPIPIPPFGTMGAVINMKEPPKNRRQLLDIGIAGPLAGVIVAIPVILIGLKMSSLDPLPMSLPRNMALQLEGNSILYLLLKFIVFHQWLPAPTSYGSLPPILYWLQFFFTGKPTPWGGLDVMISPVALAGWGGLLVTSLNLIPAGQLDGGHAMYVLFGRKTMQRIFPFILVALFGLGFLYIGWWLWAAILFLLGRTYAEPPDQITELDPKRRALAAFAILLFFLVFIPVPMSIIGM